ncbi:MAG: T9SS type A sorting domain-containing protein, partial [Bacteroidales bacterium]|nr:T9SS type A sorting domain-containing protein [Bacteroidales bacterium]
ATNNIVSLGANLSNPLYGVYGVYNLSNAPETYYHNTISLTPTRTGSTSIHTAAFYKNGWNSVVTLTNNQLINAGSGGTGSGKHLALATSNAANLTSDFNNLYTPGTNGASGLVGSTVYTTLADWQTATGKDLLSYTENPVLANPAGNYPMAYYPGAEQYGTDLRALVPTDFIGSSRKEEPTLGAWERPLVYAVDVYVGSTLQASYTRLKKAFDKINDGTHTGALTLKITTSIKERYQPVLNASGTGSASYTSVLLYPTQTGVQVYGDFNGPFIDLNGADNVTIDGRVNGAGSTPDLVLFNQNTGTNAITLRLTNSAQTNTINYVNLWGGGGSNTNGTIVFGPTGTNSGNTVSNSVITNNGTRRVHALYAAAGTNTSNILVNNRFFDTWSTAATSNSVYLGAGTSQWTLQGNSFYETTSFTPAGAYLYTHINIASSSGQGFVLTTNYLGGSAPLCGGTALTMGGTGISARYIPLSLETGNSVRTSIQGNTIANSVVASAHTNPFIAMLLQGGSFAVGQIAGNAIGDTTGTGSLQVASGSNATSYGIYVATTDSVTLSNNRIGSITLTTTNQGHSFTAVHKATVAGYTQITNNTIGSLGTTGSIRTTNTNGGIQQNLLGIALNGTGNALVSGNTVSELLNTAAQNASYVHGISIQGTGTNIVQRNYVYKLALATTNTTNVLAGLYTASGNNSLINNIVVLGSNVPAGLYFINGIRSEGSATDAVYHNTVILRGSITGSTSTYTSAYLKFGSATVTVRNNLFYNARSGGSGSGRHSAIGTNNTTGLTSNNNLLYAPNTNGVVGAQITSAWSATAYTSIANWRTYSSQDINSLNTNPSLYNINGSVAADFATGVPLGGADLRALVPTDYVSVVRSANPTMGAWEYFAPVDVYSGTTLLGSYTTLKLAFDAINSGARTGNLRIHINRNTTETASAVLNASGSGSANYSKVLIYPAFQGITVSGSLAAPLVSLNGADNVTIDGRVNGVGSTPSLTLINTGTGSAAVTLLLNNGATQDSIRYCYIKGGGGSATNGTLQYGATGTNTGNVVAYCHITNNGSRRVNAVYAVGGTNTANTLQYNRIFDTWSLAATSYGINLGTGTSGWSLTGNSLYETTDFQPSGNYTYYGISLNNTSGTGYQLTGNYIGGRDSLCTGNALSMGVAGTLRTLIFNPVFINVGTGATTTLQGNVVRNVALRSSSTTPFFGIRIDNGLVQATSNAVGDTLGTGSIQLTGTVTNAISYGMYVDGNTTGQVASNRIGAITTANTSSSNAHDMYALYTNSSGSTLSLTGNYIGSETTPSSILASGTATGNSQRVFGVYAAGTGTYLINGNRIANLTNGTRETNQASKTYGIYVTGGTTRITNNMIHNLASSGSANGSNYANVSMTGITSTNATVPQYIVNNTISNLTSYTLSQVEFYGIYMMPSSNGNDTVAGNFVEGFKMLSESTTCYLHGISMHNTTGTFTGTLSAFNNIVFLGDSITRGSNIFGILKNCSKAFNLFHNTVHLGGTVSDGSTTTSYALRDRTDGTPSVRDIRNNIFYNTRSGGGSNYALYIHSSTNVVIDYNDYGWSGTYFASVNTGSLVTLQEWLETMVGQDLHSLTIDPQFVNMGGVLPTDYKTNIGLDGAPGTGVATDFGGMSRSGGSPTMGAWENFPVDVYNGSTFRSSYFTLKTAFDAINAGTWTGDLTIKLKGSTLETATAQLNASGTGSANYSRVLIHPIRSNVVIRGNLNTDVVRLNGADNVTFDGRLNATGSTIDLTLTNLSTGALATTLRLMESATLNTVRYCQLTGAGSGATSAILAVSTATTGQGNDNNSFLNNRFTGLSTTERPYNALLSVGTTGRTNTGNTVSNNTFSNLWRPSSTSNMILLGAATDDWTLNNNSFFETTTFTPTGAYVYTAVNLNNTSGGGHELSGNYVGGTLEQGLGNPMSVGVAGQVASFVAFQVNLGNDSLTSFQGNTVTNLTVTSGSNQPFRAFYVTGGRVNIGTEAGNLIGAVAGIGKVIVTSSASNATSAGMYLGGSGVITAANNTLGAMTVTSSTGNAHNFYGLYGTGSGTLVLTNNTIGSTTTANSVQVASTTTTQAQRLDAIRYEGTGSVTIENNTISNLYNASTLNNVGNLVAGIYKTSTGSAQIRANFVDRLVLASTAVNPTLYGIWLDNGSSSCVNNVINLGVNQAGYIRLFGVYEEGLTGYTDSICHNTIYLSGTVGGTANPVQTYAFYKNANLGSTILLNNILYNVRSGGSTATASCHRAISLPGMSSVTTINGNDYLATGTRGLLGRLVATDYTTLIAWRGATGQDAQSSLSVNPGLLNAGGSSPLDYKTSGVLDGVPAGVLTDFGASERDLTTPTIGAWEYFLCVEIWTDGTMREAYTTLKDAFDDINAAAWTGNLTVKILKNTYETATANLLASGSGPNYTRVHIFPTKAGVTVAGSLNAPLVRLEGADGVSIDGRVNASGATPSLTFTNLNTGTAASTIQLAQSAQQDTLQYCIVKGAGQGTTTGVVHFGTSTIGTGNSNNVVMANTISGLNAGERPVNALYSLGTTGRVNTANQVLNNAFFDVLVAGASSNVIHLGAFTTTTTLSGNSVYNTSTLSVPTACEYALIRIDNTSGDGFLLSNNYLGGQAAQASGTWTKIGQPTTFYGIYLNVGTGTPTSLQGNTIRGFAISNTGAADMTAVHVAGGIINMGTTTGNVIGATTGTGSITLTNSTTGGVFYGINLQGSGAFTAYNNSLGSITATNTNPANATHVYGLYKAAVGGNLTLSNNLIGSSTTASSIQAASDAYNTNQLVYGIFSLGSGTNLLSGNTIANLLNKTLETTRASKLVGVYIGAGNNTLKNNTLTKLISGGSASGAQGLDAPVIGLLLNTSTAGQVVTGNTISRLQNNSTAKVYIYGLYYAGPTTGTNVLATNFINRILLPLAPPESVVCGLSLQQGTAAVSNNIIALGDSLSKGVTLYGMQNVSTSALTIYHNTLYIGGSVASAFSNTYAIRNEATGAHDVRNNVFANRRSGGGKHYAIALGSTSGLTINYNAYWADGVNGVLGLLTSDRTTLAAWKSATGQDANSLFLHPLFIQPGSTDPLDYTPTASMTAFNGLVAVDYTGAARAVPPTMGALEFNGYFWTGSLDTDWSKSSNWLPQMVPTSSVRANIPQRPNQPQVNSGVNAEAATLVIYSGAVVTINGGGTLTVATNVVNNAGVTGLVINSTASGTGSFLCDQDSIYATVRRYVNGEMALDSAAWHFLSTPVMAQTIQGSSWTPAGQYGDGTGYDLYVWDEPSGSWVYNLNDTTANYTTWSAAHPSTTFMPGRGYLYSLYDSIATPAFTGYLNNDTVAYALTKAVSGSQAGFHLVGNPYPSSIDWKATAGFDRSVLDASGGGYDLWMWSSSANNYGVYNSEETDDQGTNNASRYVAPMQGFFVKAASAGSLEFFNVARTHQSASAWLRAAGSATPGAVRVVLSSLEGYGRDEVKLSFGYTANDKGTGKLFSHVTSAPSLYLPIKGQPYTIRRLTTPEANGKTPLSFQAGVSGRYSLRVTFDPLLTSTIILEDKQTGVFHDFSLADTYTFSATSSDPANRFVLHYGAVHPEDKLNLADVYVNDQHLVVDLSQLKDEYALMVFDLNGRVVKRSSLFGGEQLRVKLRHRGVYLVSLRSKTDIYTVKVAY